MAKSHESSCSDAARWRSTYEPLCACVVCARGLDSLRIFAVSLLAINPQFSFNVALQNVHAVSLQVATN